MTTAKHTQHGSALRLALLGIGAAAELVACASSSPKTNGAADGSADGTVNDGSTAGDGGDCGPAPGDTFREIAWTTGGLCPSDTNCTGEGSVDSDGNVFDRDGDECRSGTIDPCDLAALREFVMTEEFAAALSSECDTVFDYAFSLTLVTVSGDITNSNIVGCTEGPLTEWSDRYNAAVSTVTWAEVDCP